MTVEKFNTLAQATTFLQEKRQEGYFAEVMNEGTGHLWGSMTVGGFRVMVSEEKFTEEEMAAIEESKNQAGLNPLVRFAFLGLISLGLISAAFLAIFYYRSTAAIVASIIVIGGIICIGGGIIALKTKSNPGE